MDIIKVGILGVAAVLMAIPLRKEKQEYSMFLSMAVCICIFIYIITKVQIVLEFVEKLEGMIAIDSTYIGLVIKMVGITYAAEFAVNDLEDYVELKKKWIVPISAIILRAYQLGEISYKKYMYLMNEMDKKGWLKKEPLEENIKATSPMLLKKSIDVLIDNNIMSKASLVMNLSNWGLHLNQDEVEVLLGFKEGKLTTERNTINNKKSKVTKVNFKSKKR